MTDRLGSIGTQYSDDAGNPLIDGRLYFYDSGTLTPKDTFSDVNLTKPNTNPVILDGAGRQPNVWFEGFAKIILTSSDDVQIEERDPIGSASGNSFSSWTSSVIYAENVFVQGSDGNFYRSLSAGNSGNDPTTDTTSWTRVQFIETWNANDTYAIDDIVQGSDGLLYVAITSSNTGNDPVGDIVNWVAVGSIPTLELLSSATLSSDSSVDFILPAGYSKFIAEYIEVVPSTNTVLLLRTSADGGSTFDAVAGDYFNAALYMLSNSTTVSGLAASSGSAGEIRLSNARLTHSGSVEIYAPLASTITTIKHYNTVTTSTEVGFFQGSAKRNAAEVTDAIRFITLAGTLATGTINLYGVI